MGYLYSFIKNKNMEKLTQLPKVMKQVRGKRMGWNFFPCPERSNWIPTEDVSYSKIPIRLNLLHYFPVLLFLICWMVLINLIKRQTVSQEMSYIASVWTISKNKVRFSRTQIITFQRLYKQTTLLPPPLKLWLTKIKFPPRQYSWAAVMFRVVTCYLTKICQCQSLLPKKF